jgi:dUTPase
MGLMLANGAGVVDPDYQGEIQFRFYKNAPDHEVLERQSDLADRYVDGKHMRRQTDIYEPGDRLGQLIVVPQDTHKFTETRLVEGFEEETERGEGGFGSTD